MIKAETAVAAARRLIGMPYSEMDCMALIRAVIRKSPGGVPDYRCEGTNWLWDSVNNSGKYRHLTERHEGLEGVPAGALPFKRYGADGEDHVGIATGEGTVIHSSSVYGRVVETELTRKEGWDCWGVHRYIAAADKAPAGGGSSAVYSALSEEMGWMMKSEGSELNEAYRARVNTQRGPLNIRNAPETGEVIGQIPKGEIVEAQGRGQWPLVRYGDTAGYASAQYLTPVDQEDNAADDMADSSPDDAAQTAFTSLVREDGTAIVIAGRWRLAMD